jgi:hypothetical protein
MEVPNVEPEASEFICASMLQIRGNTAGGDVTVPDAIDENRGERESGIVSNANFGRRWIGPHPENSCSSEQGNEESPEDRGRRCNKSPLCLCKQPWAHACHSGCLTWKFTDPLKFPQNPALTYREHSGKPVI